MLPNSEPTVQLIFFHKIYLIHTINTTKDTIPPLKRIILLTLLSTCFRTVSRVQNPYPSHYSEFSRARNILLVSPSNHRGSPFTAPSYFVWNKGVMLGERGKYYGLKNGDILRSVKHSPLGNPTPIHSQRTGWLGALGVNPDSFSYGWSPFDTLLLLSSRI